MTASVTGSPREASASRFSFCSTNAEICCGVKCLPSMSADQSVPIWRLTDRMVRSGLVTAWRFATSPTSTSPFLANATTLGVVRDPSALAMTLGSPPSRTVTTLLVVPRSMPTVRAMVDPPLTACPGRLRRGEAGSALSRLHSWSTGRGPLSIPVEPDRLNFFSDEGSGQSNGRTGVVARREGALAGHPHAVVLGRRVGPAPVHVAELVGRPRPHARPGGRAVPPLPQGHREVGEGDRRPGADEVSAHRGRLAADHPVGCSDGDVGGIAALAHDFAHLPAVGAKLVVPREPPAQQHRPAVERRQVEP